MAASKCVATPKVLDLTKCYLCNETFSEPKLLPCLHSFCEGCLAKDRKSREEALGESKAICPICSAVFIIPERGLCSLPTNKLAKRLLELQKVTSQDLATCCACIESEGDARPATVYCHDYEQHLCAACSSIHKRLKTTSSHTVLEIGGSKVLNVEELVKNQVEMCSEHPQERATLYCSNCLKLICTVCFVAEHKKHSCQDAVSEAAGFRTQLKESVELLSARCDWYRSEKTELKAEMQAFVSSVFEAQRGVREKADEEKRKIEEQQNELLSKLEELKEEKLAEIGYSESWFGSSMSSIEYCLQFVLDVLSKGSEGDVVGLYGDMYRRLELLIMGKPMTVTQDSVAFQAAPAPVVIEGQSQIGGMQQQFFFSSATQARPLFGFFADRQPKNVAKDDGPTQDSSCLLQNPLGELTITTTVTNRRN